uniref:50S ribosomal protein L33 n=1 Tax=Rhizophora mucronata TaxID=61149 RepID=A0A2P2Q768_RHIMU
MARVLKKLCSFCTFHTKFEMHKPTRNKRSHNDKVY